MIRRKINIACLQETKQIGEKAKEILGINFIIMVKININIEMM